MTTVAGSTNLRELVACSFLFPSFLSTARPHAQEYPDLFRRYRPGRGPSSRREPLHIYKLYRATRCGPDTAIDPGEQLAFYDAGLGSRPPGGALFVTQAFRWLHNVASQATGLGITTNIIDCYAAIIRMWEPGDRIFLFGFSRGAYTVRCLAAVLGQCGVPKIMADGTPLRRDVGATTRIAREAVKHVYQHVSSPKDTNYLPQREALAKRFRQRYGSDTGDGSNAPPFFIGVFDTVASLGSYSLSAVLVGVTATVIPALSFVQSFFLFPFLPAMLWTAAGAAVAAGIGYVATHLKYAVGLPGYSLWRTLHLASPKMRFYDLQLNNAVWYARHALAIDENRADFARVPWGGSHNKGPQRPDEYPTGCSRSGLRETTPTSVAATRKTRHAYPTFR
ncbi:phospholipase effector Tle1 domain-containing protein [Bradyrhizobium sp. HKCCYLS20291]|uniref:phospholipase effector Tle1 domain-containing protein n=1 Tax=Bradyrhizobium sp. HKCCYLS20291 TaxID=3420766 RepID=UPI003EBA516B